MGGHFPGNRAEAPAPVDALDARERAPARAPCDSGNGGPATVAPLATPSPPRSTREEAKRIPIRGMGLAVGAGI
ncbi:MAG: hypothetical protein RL345_1891 [Chloroflexota bacterium]